MIRYGVDALSIVLLVVTFVAISKVLVRAGYSPWWVVVPLAPVLVIGGGLGWAITRGRPIRITGRGITAHFAGTSIGEVYLLGVAIAFVAWVFFLVFAFANWPGPGGRPREKPRKGDASTPDDAAPLAPAGRGGGAAPVEAAGGTAVATSMARTSLLVEERPEDLPDEPEEVATIFCSWCGKERAADAHAIHHCGSKQRPASFCMKCGTSLAPEALDCARCGTPSTEVSRF